MIWVQKEFNYAAKVGEITEWLQSLPGKVLFPPSMLLITIPPNVIRILVVVAYEEGEVYVIPYPQVIESEEPEPYAYTIDAKGNKRPIFLESQEDS